MLLRLFVYITMAALITLFSCAPKHADIILVKYNDSAITLGEFENEYAQNSGGIEKAKSDTITQYRTFLDLYTNYKMKLKDAQMQGFDKDTTLNNELLDYKKKVGVTYLLDKQLVEPGIKKLYEQRKYELRVSHLMIHLDSTGKEAARLKADSLLSRIKKGESFDSLVAIYSEDMYSKDVKGDIYYITGGVAVPEFVDAAYSTPAGQIYPEVVKSKYGYHIIKVTERRERVPEISASHILVTLDNKDSATAKARIDSVKMLLARGESFDSLAKKYSDDADTKNDGGSVGTFERRMMVKEFDEAAFNLKNVGDISDIVKTPYGYHIIKLTAKKPYPTFSDNEEELKKIYKLSHYDVDYNNLVSELENKYNYKLDQSVVDKLTGYKDTLMLNASYWRSNLKNDFGNLTLFSLGATKIPVDTFFAKLIALPEYSSKIVNKDIINVGIKRVSGDMVLEEEALTLDKVYPEFAELMNEYRDGIYIFKLQDNEVWNKINLDSAKIYAYWLKNKSNYKWTDRIEIGEIFSNDSLKINEYYKMLNAGKNFDTLAAKYTERDGYKEKAGRYPLEDVLTSDLHVHAFTMNVGEYTEPLSAPGGGFSIIKVYSKDPARLKTYEEARAEASGAFQEEESKRLDNEYLNYLNKMYSPKYFYEELTKAYKIEE